MPTYKIHVRQWVEEIAEIIVDAESEEAARAQIQEDQDNLDGDSDEFDWQDGSNIDHFEIVTVEELER